MAEDYSEWEAENVRNSRPMTMPRLPTTRACWSWATLSSPSRKPSRPGRRRWTRPGSPARSRACLPRPRCSSAPSSSACGARHSRAQETLASKQQTYQQQYDTAGQFGQYSGRAAHSRGSKTSAGAEQAYTQALRAQQEARAAQAQQQTQAQQYLQLLSSLRGPADWVKYQQVLGATPGGMRDLVGAAMGQYVPGGGATTGYQPAGGESCRACRAT